MHQTLPLSHLISSEKKIKRDITSESKGINNSKKSILEQIHTQHMKLLSISAGSILLSSLLVCRHLVAATEYICIIGPDASGNSVTHQVNEKFAQTCDPSSCQCSKVPDKENKDVVTCLLGPDSNDNFATITAKADFAKSCDRGTCTCSTHSDYQIVTKSRLEGAIDRNRDLIKQT